MVVAVVLSSKLGAYKGNIPKELVLVCELEVFDFILFVSNLSSRHLSYETVCTFPQLLTRIVMYPA